MDNNNRYIFDKRVIKKVVLKYGIILFALFLILVPINTLLSSIMESGIVFVDILIGLVFILLVETILDKIEKKREEKAELKRLEEKRAKRQAKKANKEDIVVEIENVKVRNGKEKDTEDKKEDK